MTDRQRERQTDRPTDMIDMTDRHTERQRDMANNGQTGGDRERERDRCDRQNRHDRQTNMTNRVVFLHQLLSGCTLNMWQCM